MTSIDLNSLFRNADNADGFLSDIAGIVVDKSDRQDKNGNDLYTALLIGRGRKKDGSTFITIDFLNGYPAPGRHLSPSSALGQFIQEAYKLGLTLEEVEGQTNDQHDDLVRQFNAGFGGRKVRLAEYQDYAPVVNGVMSTSFKIKKLKLPTQVLDSRLTAAERHQLEQEATEAVENFFTKRQANREQATTAESD